MIPVVVFVLTLTRIIKSEVTGQAPVTLELRNTPGKNTNKPKVEHARITAHVFHASQQKHIKVKSGVSVRCARSILVHTSYSSRLEKPTIPLATQERLPRIYCTFIIVPITTHTHDTRKSTRKKKQKKEKKMKERKEKATKRNKEKGKERKEKTRKAKKDKTSRGSKETKREKNVILADPRNWLKTTLGS